MKTHRGRLHSFLFVLMARELSGDSARMQTVLVWNVKCWRENFFSVRCGNLYLEFIRVVELSSNCFSFGLSLTSVLPRLFHSLWKSFRFWVEDCADIEISLCFNLELRWFLCLDITDNGVRGMRTNANTFLYSEKKSKWNFKCSNLVGCYVMSVAKWLPTFGTKEIPSSSGSVSPRNIFLGPLDHLSVSQNTWIFRNITVSTSKLAGWTRRREMLVCGR